MPKKFNNSESPSKNTSFTGTTKRSLTINRHKYVHNRQKKSTKRIQKSGIINAKHRKNSQVLRLSNFISFKKISPNFKAIFARTRQIPQEINQISKLWRLIALTEKRLLVPTVRKKESVEKIPEVKN